MLHTSRRSVLKMMGALPLLPLFQPLMGCKEEAAQKTLRVVERSIEVRGRAAKVFGLMDAKNNHGLRFNKGDIFSVKLINEASEPTLVHWHGLTPPWRQDGVPGITQQPIEAGKSYDYNFPIARSGTNWMHAHTLQEQALLAAPLIIDNPDDKGRDEQEVIMMLHDFSYRSPKELLAILLKGGGHVMDHSAMGHDMGSMKMEAAPPAMQMDVNDIEYDAYLANDRTLEDPEVVNVETGGKIRLRIINAASSTGFTIDLGALQGELIAVDGMDIVPFKASRFPMTMAQRMDIRITLPKDNSAYPVLALREGGLERTGIILAPKNAAVTKMESVSVEKNPILDLNLEFNLRSAEPLEERAVTREVSYHLHGTMSPYAWDMQRTDDASNARFVVKEGDRVKVTLVNQSMMAHPVHLHGHHFQVVGINGKAFSGAMRDTVLVPPNYSVDIVFDANNPGLWAFHCHHLYHMMTGMMNFITYEGV